MVCALIHCSFRLPPTVRNDAETAKSVVVGAALSREEWTACVQVALYGFSRPVPPGPFSQAPIARLTCRSRRPSACRLWLTREGQRRVLSPAVFSRRRRSREGARRARPTDGVANSLERFARAHLTSSWRIGSAHLPRRYHVSRKISGTSH